MAVGAIKNQAKDVETRDEIAHTATVSARRQANAITSASSAPNSRPASWSSSRR